MAKARLSLYLDTNIFLNVIYKESKFKSKSAELLRKVQAGEFTATTSVVTLLEVVLDMANIGLKDKTEVATGSIEDLRGLTIAHLDGTMSKAAAQYVLEERITVHDAYHLATALHSKASYFVTRDAGLSEKIRKFLKVVTPEDLMSPKSSTQSFSDARRGVQLTWTPSGRGSQSNLLATVSNYWQGLKDVNAVPSDASIKIEDAVDIRFLPQPLPKQTSLTFLATLILPATSNPT